MNARRARQGLFQWAHKAVLCGVLGFGTLANAAPLTMQYQVNPIGGGLYQYDFTLTLDDHDSSWLAGQEWDWIIFGQNDSGDNYNGFDPDGSGAATPDWATLSFSAPITGVTTSYGGYNGPTLEISGSVTLPGWNPAAVGEFLSWSGTSSLLIPNGELYWSAINTKDTPLVFDELAVAVSGPAAVPEPGTLALPGCRVLCWVFC